MSQKYTVTVGDIILFGGKVGILISDPFARTDFTLLSITRDGEVADTTNQYHEAIYFSEAKLFTGEITREMKIAIDAIKIAVR